MFEWVPLQCGLTTAEPGGVCRPDPVECCWRQPSVSFQPPPPSKFGSITRRQEAKNRHAPVPLCQRARLRVAGAGQYCRRGESRARGGKEGAPAPCPFVASASGSPCSRDAGPAARRLGGLPANAQEGRRGPRPAAAVFTPPLHKWQPALRTGSHRRPLRIQPAPSATALLASPLSTNLALTHQSPCSPTAPVSSAPCHLLPCSTYI